MLQSAVIKICRYKYHDYEKKRLPAMTICPMHGFKQKGFFYKHNDVLTNTLDFNDLISSNDLIIDAKTLVYDEPVAQQIGRCNSLSYNEGVHMNDGFVLLFTKQFDLKIYFHPKGDELWLTGYQAFPYEVASVDLDIAKRQSFSAAMLSIKEVRSIMHSRPEMPCIDYSEESDNEHELFTNCCKENMWKNLPSDITCTVAEMKKIIPANSTLRECNNVEEAIKMYWKFVEYHGTFVTNSWHYNCPVPCKQKSYKLKLDFYHKSSALLPQSLSAIDSEELFTLNIFYSPFTVEEKIESLEYDFANVLVSAGGNLGLFLGFSCLTVMFKAIEWLQAKYEMYCHYH